MSALLVALGAMIGAPTRYLIDVVVTSRVRSPFPWGTFAVNAAGSFILGLIAGLTAHGSVTAWPQTLIGAGFCGALTTFSTFSYDTVRLVEAGRLRTAATNTVGSILLCFAALSLGWWLGSL